MISKWVAEGFEEALIDYCLAETERYHYKWDTFHRFKEFKLGKYGNLYGYVNIIDDGFRELVKETHEVYIDFRAFMKWI